MYSNCYIPLLLFIISINYTSFLKEMVEHTITMVFMYSKKWYYFKKMKNWKKTTYSKISHKQETIAPELVFLQECGKFGVTFYLFGVTFYLFGVTFCPQKVTFYPILASANFDVKIQQNT